MTPSNHSIPLSQYLPDHCTPLNPRQPPQPWKRCCRVSTHWRNSQWLQYYFPKQLSIQNISKPIEFPNNSWFGLVYCTLPVRRYTACVKTYKFSPTRNLALGAGIPATVAVLLRTMTKQDKSGVNCQDVSQSVQGGDKSRWTCQLLQSVLELVSFVQGPIGVMQ